MLASPRQSYGNLMMTPELVGILSWSCQRFSCLFHADGERWERPRSVLAQATEDPLDRRSVYSVEAQNGKECEDEELR